ncbi:GDSL-type esterase/lipase family protein [Pseudescherichia vulneris]|uniref:tail fiber/spike domain-containing protein n=1 Tax=Pseudescherichia vulneris TaxID=566 RepID=UPI0028D60B83|nr:GDSL-type esterase/lipase family protein [Pseudescherichia vulneris]
MATNPTQNPVPSESPRDLKFNAGKFDELITSMANQYIDRFGRAHYTVEGLKKLILDAIYNLGFNPVGNFQRGATLSSANDIIQDAASAVWYRWDDTTTLPKVVPAGSTPATTGGIGDGRWVAVDVSDLLRRELIGSGGAAIIGTENGHNLQDNLNAMPVFQNRDAVTRANIPSWVNKIRILADETGNNWFGIYTTEDLNNSTNVVSSDGRTWMKELEQSTRLYGTIVVFGSSTAGGFGTSDFTEYPSLNTNWQSSPSSWPSLLQKKLGLSAKVINRSIGGYTTQTNIDRFMRDVAPHNPDYVILCTGWFNEPGGNDYEKGANYIAGTRVLIELCRHIGAQPIVAPLQALGAGNSTAPQYDIARAMATENIPVLDLASFVMQPGSVALVQDKFNYGDGVHTNSAAHALYVEAFDLGYLYRKERAPFNYQIGKGIAIGAHSTPALTRAPVRMWVNRDKSFGPKDWTAQVTLKSPNAGDKGGVPMQIILEDEATFLKVRAYSPDAPTVRLTKADNTVLIDSGVAWDNAKDLSIAVSYQSSTDSLILLVGSVTSSTLTGAGLSSQRLSAVHFGGMNASDSNTRMSGWVILAANVWRTAVGHTFNSADRFMKREFLPSGLIGSLGTEFTNGIVGDNKANGYVIITLYNTSSIAL